MESFGRTTTISGSNVRTQILTTFFFAAVTAVCAQVSFRLWFSPVPVTLQVLGVLLSGLVLGSRLGALSQISYLAMGAMGLPVFAGFTGGPVAFAGPTGGYLIGFVIGAFAAGWVFERLGGHTKLAAWAGGIAGILGIYLPGALWLAVWIGLTGQRSLEACILGAWQLGIVPFIGLDILKAAAASTLALGGHSGYGLIRSFRNNI